MPKKKANDNVSSIVDTTVGSNSKVRAERIREAFSRIAEIEDEIDSMRLKHLEPLTKERTLEWRDVKKDLDIPRKVLEVEYRRFKMARDGRTDDDGGDLVMDQMKEVFQALHPGNTIDWIAALEGMGAGED